MRCSLPAPSKAQKQLKREAILTVVIAFAALGACADGALLPPDREAEGTVAALSYSESDAPGRGYDEGGNWLEMSSDSLWAAIQRSGGLVHVGLKAPDRRRGVYNGARLVSASTQTRGESAVLAIAGVRLERRHERMPVLRVHLSEARALETIRRLPFVDYVEPAHLPQEAGFASQPMYLMSDPGCGYPEWQSGSHYYQDGEMIPHRYGLMGIQNAWSLSRGRGVIVGVVDSGLDSNQSEMTTAFASGFSTGREVRAFTVIDETLDGPCSHGPRMGSLTTAPRNGTSTVGVAHESHLISVRFTDGIVDVDAWEAARAIDRVMWYSSDLGSRRVMPMAWRSAPSGHLSDVIDDHYTRGTLFVGAVGQSECRNPFRGVAWPARKENVIAVAGLEDDHDLPCEMHRGPETDMAALKNYPVPGHFTGQIAEIKESSSATAVVAGVAALIWARYPTWTRDQVVQRIHQSGYHYPWREERVGYGVINAYRAVGGFEYVRVDAPNYALPGSTFTVTANPRGDGPFTYLWSNGATTQSTTFSMGTFATQADFSVSVTDPLQGVTHTEYVTVLRQSKVTEEPQ